jgi:hypothetical protein
MHLLRKTATAFLSSDIFVNAEKVLPNPKLKNLKARQVLLREGKKSSKQEQMARKRAK